MILISVIGRVRMPNFKFKFALLMKNILWSLYGYEHQEVTKECQPHAFQYSKSIAKCSTEWSPNLVYHKYLYVGVLERKTV